MVKSCRQLKSFTYTYGSNSVWNCANLYGEFEGALHKHRSTLEHLLLGEFCVEKKVLVPQGKFSALLNEFTSLKPLATPMEPYAQITAADVSPYNSYPPITKHYP
jgi:hypothetical protein